MKLAALILLVAVPAYAEDKIAAESAFRAAKELERAGKLAEACPLYEASYRADPALGALLNLASCHAQTGRTGTAWAEYREAVELATRKADHRADYARKRLAELEPRLVRLRVEAPAGVTVERNGTDITALLAQDLVVDPGTYRVRASAPHKVAWETSVGVSREGETVRVAVPELARDAPSPARVDAPKTTVTPNAPKLDVPPPKSDAGASKRVADPQPARSSRRTVAIAIGATGLATAVVGLGFGYHARSQWNASRASCDDTNICNPTGVAQIDSARSSAQLATWGISAGATLVVAAGVVWLTAPSRSETRRMAVAPMLDREQVGLAAFARF